MDDVEALIREYLTVQAVPLVPEIRLWLARELVPLWQATEWRAAAPQPPPFWAFVWPGSHALARYVSDHPSSVRARRVLDFGSGGGLASIAAARAGAGHVAACDCDPRALIAQAMNADLNGVAFDRHCADCTSLDLAAQADVILAGDVCYEREPALETVAWLRRAAQRGADVLLADPGRRYVPTDGLELVQTYDVPTLKELESTELTRTRLWRLLPG